MNVDYRLFYADYCIMIDHTSAGFCGITPVKRGVWSLSITGQSGKQNICNQPYP